MRAADVEKQLDPCPFCGCRVNVLKCAGKYTLAHPQSLCLLSNTYYGYVDVDWLLIDWNRRIDPERENLTMG